MDINETVVIINEFLVLTMHLIAPAIITSLLVGVIISIFQTVTSIQEQTLTFAPRILAVAVVFSFSAAASLSALVTFTEKYFMQIAEIGVTH